MQISGVALAHIVHRNPELRCMRAGGCKQLIQKESNFEGRICLSPSSCKELYAELGRASRMEELVLGWGFSSPPLKALEPAIKSLKEITVCLGASFGEDQLTLLPKICPALESVTLYFQVCISVEHTCIVICIIFNCKEIRVLHLFLFRLCEAN